ncbi:MAG: hypothetical protein RBS80_06095 [Thermoguttaceae bacterium]|nr:hypothetical protein [Thermoguttaceae bacterium]
MKRLILAGLGICHIVFAIGLIRRCRWAWFAFLAYIILGVAWTAAGLILSPPETDQGPAINFAVAGLLLGGALVVGLYFATKPAFRPTVERPPDES